MVFLNFCVCLKNYGKLLLNWWLNYSWKHFTSSRLKKEKRTRTGGQQNKFQLTQVCWLVFPTWMNLLKYLMEIVAGPQIRVDNSSCRLVLQLPALCSRGPTKQFIRSGRKPSLIMVLRRKNRLTILKADFFWTTFSCVNCRFVKVRSQQIPLLSFTYWVLCLTYLSIFQLGNSF